MVKRPERVLRGHASPVLACALSYALGVAVTVSAAAVGAMRCDAMPSSDIVVPMRGILIQHNPFFPCSHQVLVHSIEDPHLVRRVGMAPSLRLQGFGFAHALLAKDGFVVLGMRRRAEGGEEVSRLQVHSHSIALCVLRTYWLRYHSNPHHTQRYVTPTRRPISTTAKQVWTVNGNIVAERELRGGGKLVRLALLGAGR